MSTFGLFWRTVRHLTIRQLFFQVLHRMRGRPRLRFPKTIPMAYFLTLPSADKPVSWQAGTFTFLNKSYSPGPGPIDWNYRNAGPFAYGKLWTYQLNYFDFLNQPTLPPNVGVALMHDFMAQTDRLRDGLESYPTSLRLLNWIQFLSRNQIQGEAVDHHLAAQVNLLSRRLEYHITGNHLLENGYALLMGSLYFRHKRWFRTAAQLIQTELTTQILTDGGHNERSPVYHQLLLDRLLMVLLALQHDTWHKDYHPALVDFLTHKAHQLLDWLNAVTFRNGDVPMVNDSASGMAPTPTQLRVKAGRVLVAREGFTALSPSLETATSLSDSGYRMFRQDRYELFADVGPVGPNHQPGHAHADTLSLVLNVDNLPLIVDSGTSTYQTGPRRTWERSTVAHNTVTIDDENSSEVWAGFRVGRRARVTVLTDTQTSLIASHDGYYPMGIIHERAWLVEPTKIILSDHLIRVHDKTDVHRTGVARFYFYPTVQVVIADGAVMAGPVRMSFSSVNKLNLYSTNYNMAEGFNRLRTGQCLTVVFTNRLETTISLTG